MVHYITHQKILGLPIKWKLFLLYIRSLIAKKFLKNNDFTELEDSRIKTRVY